MRRLHLLKRGGWRLRLLRMDDCTGRGRETRDGGEMRAVKSTRKHNLMSFPWRRSRSSLIYLNFMK